MLWERTTEMKRVATKAIILAALAILSLSGTAQAFTPVPIPKPLASTLALSHHLP
jgi:hypothetical protein